MENAVTTNHADRRRHEGFVALPVVEYVTEHEAGLWHAARLLGGYGMARLVDRLADASVRIRD